MSTCTLKSSNNRFVQWRDGFEEGVVGGEKEGEVMMSLAKRNTCFELPSFN